MEKFERMEKPFLIAEAEPADAEGIGSVQDETWLATYPNEDLGITREEIEAMVAKRFPTRTERWRKAIEGEAGNRRIWVAKDTHGKVVGFSSAKKGQEENKVTAIYVLPETQRMGVGRELMEGALGWLGSDKLASLAVVKYNQAAITFYKKFGFEEAGDVAPTDLTMLPSGKKMPQIKMTKPPLKKELGG